MTLTPSRTPSRTATPTATRTPTIDPSREPPFDIDGNHVTEPYTDGILITRWLFHLRGNALVATATAGNCTRCDASTIEAHLASIGALLDVDGNGDSNALTDGVLALRWLLDVRGDALIAGAVDTVNCSRCSSQSISDYIARYSL